MNLCFKNISLNECIDVIKNNNYCHIAMSKNNKPYLIPLNYSLFSKRDYDNKEQYYVKIISLCNSKKVSIIKENNFVNILIEEYIENSVISVLGFAHLDSFEQINQLMVSMSFKLDYLTGRVISNK